jgi:hypothetical protein
MRSLVSPFSTEAVPASGSLRLQAALSKFTVGRGGGVSEERWKWLEGSGRIGLRGWELQHDPVLRNKRSRRNRSGNFSEPDFETISGSEFYD